SANEGECDAGKALAGALERLDRARAESRQAMDVALTQAAEQESRLELARVSLGFLSRMSEQIDSLRRRMEDAQASLGASRDFDRDAAGERLGQRYTVASEREIHRRMMTVGAGNGIAGNDADKVFAEAPAESVQANEEELGANVELF